MDDLLRKFFELSTTGEARLVITALVWLVVGWTLVRTMRWWLPLRRLHPQHQLIVGRLVKYTLVSVSVGGALQAIGADLSVLLGAAGILTVAVGFAAQTSASNLISGLFLMAEQPFVIGDVITVGDATGTVVSIDLLSVRLRTFDNLLVRLPNEAMLKSNVTNLTHFPLRRLDMQIGVAYKEDIARVRDILMAVADANLICLVEPKPLIIFIGYGSSSIDLQFSVWGLKDNYLELRNSMYEGVKKAFDEHGIEIPFPHVTLFMGVKTTPSPIRQAGAA